MTALLIAGGLITLAAIAWLAMLAVFARQVFGTDPSYRG